LTNVTVIDGNGGPPAPKMTLVISGGRIADMFVTGTKGLPAKATSMDLSGHYVIPGLIDSHVHLTRIPEGLMDWQLRTLLLGGVTAVRDMGGDGVVLAQLAKQSSSGETQSPRVYFSALLAGPAWFSDPRAQSAAHGKTPGEVPWLRAVTAQSDIAKIVTEAREMGATGVKLYEGISADVVTKITKEAHRQGLKVWGHATVFPARPRDLAAAGVDVLSHSSYLYGEDVETVPDRFSRTLEVDNVQYKSDALTALLRLMKERGIVLDATLFLNNFRAEVNRPTPPWQDLRRMLEFTFAITRRAKELGVTIAAGTDGAVAQNNEPPNIHKEMELLVTKCGLTPLEAITAATRTGAQILGTSSLYGTIAKGKLADLVVLSDDPSSDIRNTRKIVYVIKGGKLYKRPSA
jgi:imidazolonepropionase-like amidohydrolase